MPRPGPMDWRYRRGHVKPPSLHRSLGASRCGTTQVPTPFSDVLIHGVAARRNQAGGPSTSSCGAMLRLIAAVHVRVPGRRPLHGRLLLPRQPAALRSWPLLMLLFPMPLLLLLSPLLLTGCLVHHDAQAGPSAFVTPARSVTSTAPPQPAPTRLPAPLLPLPPAPPSTLPPPPPPSLRRALPAPRPRPPSPPSVMVGLAGAPPTVR